MEKLKLFIVGFVFGIVHISLGSLDNLDDRWKIFCDDPWFENCRNIGVLWKCQKFNQCIETWMNNSVDYNEYFQDQLNSTIENVFDANGNIKVEYIPSIEYRVIKIDVSIHSAANPFVTYPNIDNDTDVIED
ncbi:hypothetical protein PV328_004499 [Microctonus aethiopoides]|uniref:Uncharacterized protein n=1 Tax=Microctonus aethiopoides TaxID=144406 RepID=A0AA39KLP3_9HYME|nr:hypothetical protein PV328_004499 [Microctonus aethiopoides]